MRIARLAIAAVLLALAACAHAPDERSVQQAVEDAVAGG
jgi:hypothetical protein